MPWTLSRQPGPATRYHPAARWDGVSRPALPVAELIYPLHYCLLVRRRFLEYYDSHRELYRRDPEQFLRAIRSSDFAFHVWRLRYRKPAWWPYLHSREADRRLAYRVRRFVSLLEEIRSSGFDQGQAIQIRCPDGPIRTREGKEFTRPFLLGDGGHRLAVLLHLGYQELPARFWVPVGDGPGEVPDSTYRYLQAGRVSEEEYQRFVLYGCGEPDAADLEALFRRRFRRGSLAEGDPVRLAELANGIPIDYRALRRPLPGWFLPYREEGERYHETVFQTDLAP